METQQFGRVENQPHAGEFDHMLHPGASGGLDRCRLPVYRTFRDGRQKKRLFHALQGRVESLRLIKVAHSQLDVRAFEMRSLGRISHERANRLPHSGQLSDKFCPLFPVAPVISIMDYLPVMSPRSMVVLSFHQTIRNQVLEDFCNQSVHLKKLLLLFWDASSIR